MYHSKEFLQKKSTSTLKKYLQDFLKSYSFVRCKALGNRKVFLAKLPWVMLDRKDLRDRLRSFWVGVDILKHSDQISSRRHKGKIEYEVKGLSAENKKIYVHFREEATKKDKRLFFISNYYKD